MNIKMRQLQATQDLQVQGTMNLSKIRDRIKGGEFH